MTTRIKLPSGYILDPNSVVVEGIDWKDYPDFCDAFISEAKSVRGIQLDQSDIDWLNNQRDLRYEFVYSATESGLQDYD